ncbi:ABC transporter ATP-binding protein [Pseudarthrobacter sp. PH31-O2]|uniref:ABC transporter ATP-binding protein n=1 Tax=Pseudarthrobacter sp. PH31-O2 TaxID=3046206 RepID=UPI0024BBE991|nr:ABC transporter ATP-binding protein [Pseudarthrobacter sp. PH31-O2]MDJ0351359.1 ABC transporter ATP-binding protein [Pseudarthrobacter sp. PH31-O2]
MAESSELNFVEGTPSVVIDKVSMTYKTTSRSRDEAAPSPSTWRMLKPNVGRTTAVSVTALKELSLVVEHGESVGIIGRNGSGKSTLLKVVGGQIPPTSGAVYATSTPVMLGVNAALIPGLSGDQNIILGCLAMGMNRRQIDAKYAAIVELSGLEEAIHMPMKSYSAGMGSRLRFAIAAAIDPEILIIDEALNTGDAQFKDRTRKRMLELLGQAGTVFLVSHSMSTILDLCNRAIWIDQGELLADGAPADVVKWYRLFTQRLADGDRVGALKIRRRMVHDLHVADVSDRNSLRRTKA